MAEADPQTPPALPAKRLCFCPMRRRLPKSGEEISRQIREDRFWNGKPSLEDV